MPGTEGHPKRPAGPPRRSYGDPAVGTRLRTFRRLHDLKQDDLAALWRTDRKLVGFYEQGRRRLPVDKAKILAEKYRDLDLNWLLLGRGAPPGSELSQELTATVEALERRVQRLEELPFIHEALSRIEARLEELAIAADTSRSPIDQREKPKR